MKHKATILALLVYMPPATLLSPEQEIVDHTTVNTSKTLEIDAHPTIKPTKNEQFNTLVGLINQRLLLSETISAVKYFDRTPVDNPIQERKVFQKLHHTAEKNDISPEYVHRVFIPIIDSMKSLEYFYLNKWNSNTDSAPDHNPRDIDNVRQEISSLSDNIVQQLSQMQLHLYSPTCSQNIQESITDIARRKKINNYHYYALTNAMKNICLQH